MKTNIIKLVIISIFTILLVASAKAQCPEGYTEHTVSDYFEYFYNTANLQCPFSITYCCKWNTETEQVDAIIETITLGNGYACWFPILFNWELFVQFLDEVNARTAKAAYDSCGPLYPPCDDPNNPYIITNIISYSCKKILNLEEPYTPGAYYIQIRNCGSDNYCKETYKLCSDYSKLDSSGRPLTVTTFLGREQYGTPNCQYGLPQIPPPGMTWEHEWASVCFSRGCN